MSDKDGVRYMIQRIEELKAMNNELRKQADKLASSVDNYLNQGSHFNWDMLAQALQDYGPQHHDLGLNDL